MEKGIVKINILSQGLPWEMPGAFNYKGLWVGIFLTGERLKRANVWIS